MTHGSGDAAPRRATSGLTDQLHKETSTMNIGKRTTHCGFGIISLIASVILCPSIAQAQDHQSHAAQNDRHPLVRAVRQATERFKDVAAAEAEGYALQFGCVSGPDFGAMGLHYVKPSLFDGEPDPTRPEAIIYEPLPDGRLKLIGAEFVVPAELWDTTHEAAPQLMGQLFHLLEGPNRFGRASLYALHVWAWKENPNGAFVNWHPNVSCEAFNPLLPGLASIDLRRPESRLP